MYYVHGLTGTPLYKCWDSMKQRCYNLADINYKRYGKRGIRVCREWKYNFIAFRKWALENGYKRELTLDRENNNGNYEPDNCRWATSKVQNNNSSFNRQITIDGETKTIAQWTEDTRCSVASQTVYTRLNRGWDNKTAVFQPPRWYRNRKAAV